MASQYTRLPMPAGEEVAPALIDEGNAAYEPRSIPHQEYERYDPLTSLSHEPHPDPLVGNHSYAPYHSDAPGSQSTSWSPARYETTYPAATTAQSLSSQSDRTKKSKDSNRPNPKLRSTMLSWVIELIATTVTLGALLAIILVLQQEDGKPVSSWTFAVTLNTVIATLGTLGRSTLAFALSACIGQSKWNWLYLRADTIQAWERFDEASRGPWGATRLFIWLRARHWAALGALAVIGTVAFDPFLQAVIATNGQLDDYLDPVAPAQIPQALVVDAGTVVQMPGGPMARQLIPGTNDTLTLLGGSFPQPDFGMVSAIYNGFRNDASWSDDDQVVNNVCTTGNCTWPGYTTAAICSACNDLSNEVRVKKTSLYVGGSRSGGSNVPPPTNMMETGSYTAFTLQYVNITNKDTKIYFPLTKEGWNGQTGTLLTANTTFDPLETTTFQDLQTMIISFKVMQASKEWMQGNLAWNLSKPIATECALYFCVNQYRAESNNGQIKETRVNSWAVRDPKSFQADLTSETFGQGPEVDKWVAFKGNTLYDKHVPRLDLRLLVPLDESTGSGPGSFNISYNFIRTLGAFLADLSTAPEDLGLMAYPTWDSSMTPLVNALWESRNLTLTFNHIALSLTNQLRNAASNASHIGHALGVTQRWETHVRVRWPYLAFPASMIAIGISYVLLTIVQSTRLHVPVWKESALPSLLHGLDNETQSLLRDGQSQATGFKAHETIVRFGRDEKDDRLRLIPQ